MSDPNDPNEWATYAEEDYAIARSALRRKVPFVITSCFHAQQCAEKYLKALLVAHQREFPKIHDLLALNDLCEQGGFKLPMESDQLDTLTSYAARTRYPGTDPTIEEARHAIEIAKTVRRQARKMLGLR